jgi:hypothetical protein
MFQREGNFQCASTVRESEDVSDEGMGTYIETNKVLSILCYHMHLEINLLKIV